MALTRRDFLKASSAVGAALGVTTWVPDKALAANGAPPVVWLQGQGCTGCSVSLLNSIYYMTVDTLLTQTLDLKYHATVMAGAGSTAIGAAEAARAAGGYILCVEGAVPTGANGAYCTVWPGMTMYNAVRTYAASAKYIVAVGTCASFGGISAGKPNPTSAKSVKAVTGKTVLSIPGCPAHPDWLVGSVAYILKNGSLPALDANGRPTDYYGTKVHAKCPFNLSANYSHSGGRPCSNCHEGRAGFGGPVAAAIGSYGCQYYNGCKGILTGCDCSTRMWNSPAANTPGVNWCVGARSTCIGCTEPNFPDGMSPFSKVVKVAGGSSGTGGDDGGGDD